MAEAGAGNKLPTLHYLNNSQGQRILWLLEELGIEYNIKLYERNPKTQRAPPELSSIHPLGKSPILTTELGGTIVESSAIAAYLIKAYDVSGKFTSEDWLKDEVLTSFAGSSIGLTNGIELLFDILAKHTPWPFRYLTRGIQSGIRKGFSTAEYIKAMEFLDGELGDNDWFNGKELGRSDIVMSWPFDTIVQRKFFDISGYPKLVAWRERIQQRPAWKRALEKGNGYDLTSW